MTDRQFKSYANVDLPRKKIKKYAAQYDCVDMVELLAFLLAETEEIIPYVLRVLEDQEWLRYGYVSGERAGEFTFDDPVWEYATVQYLIRNGYPVFESDSVAEAFFDPHNDELRKKWLAERKRTAP